MKKYILPILITFVVVNIAYGATALPGYLGGTGLATTTIGNIGKVLQITTANPITYTPVPLVGGGTTINSQTSPFTFSDTGTITVTSTGSNFSWNIVGSPITTTTGDWLGTWQLKIPSDFLSSSTVFQTPITLSGTTYLGVASSSGTWTFTNNGVQSISAGNGILVSSATGTPTITNTQPHVTSTVVTPLSISGNQISMPTSTASQDGFLRATDFSTFNNKVSSSSATQITFTDSNVKKYGDHPLCQLLFSYATSSSQWFDDCIIGTTSTITRVLVKNQTNADSLTWNLYYKNTIPQATTTTGFKVFTADQTTNTTTTATLIPTASSTLNGTDFVRLFAYNASSTEFSITIMGIDR